LVNLYLSGGICSDAFLHRVVNGSDAIAAMPG